MSSRSRLAALTLCLAALALAPAPAPAIPQQPAVTVEAAGNPITGGMEFDPPRVGVTIGQAVEWTNTDLLVAHTATEDHHLWNLSGDYGDPLGLFPRGFGPGESVQRPFESGTHRYFCVIHPEAMKGVVSVPVDLRMIGLRERRRGRSQVVRYVSATWAIAIPEKGQGFDVQRRRGTGAWETFREATRQTGALFAAGRAGTTWHVRARLRKLDDANAATDWSPEASIVSDQPAPRPRRRR